MAVYRLGDIAPQISPSAYIAPTASVIGKAVLADRSSVCLAPLCVVTTRPSPSAPAGNVQDGAVLHTDPGFP